METLGNRIQKLREENNLNKEQFGKSIGITGTGLNNYEKDYSYCCLLLDCYDGHGTK